MKRILFLSLFFTCLTLSAQTVTNVDANQVGKTIEITYDLDRTADISVDYSTDGGRTYKPLHRVSGDVGRGITAGYRTITWDVLSEVDKFVGDNICFRVNATTDANGHEWVDLGLSVKWATCNVGATKPEEYGNYYAWGETKPKRKYSWSTYKWCKGIYNSFTKYCTQSSRGTVDNKTVLDLEDDAARANWGSAWRMPTDAEWTELFDNCTWTWTSDYNGTGVKGRIVTSNNNGNSIFLPAAGLGDELIYAGNRGFYWSSSLSADAPNYAWDVYFDSAGYVVGGSSRFYGRSVRPVL